MVLAGHRTHHERAAFATVAVRDGHFEHTVRGLFSVARLDGTTSILRGKVGQTERSAESAHLFQSVGLAAVSDDRGASRETAAGRRGDQHIWH